MKMRSTRRFAGFIAVSVAIASFAAPATAAVLINTSAYTQNFDMLASTGSSSTLPAGWLIAESGANADGAYAADAGTSNAGNTYSYGASGSTDRALGSLASGPLVSQFGSSFVNNIGSAISSLTIAYTGEQWRNGGSNLANTLVFEYSTNATSLTTGGTWTAVTALDFTSPTLGTTAGALDGNAAANRTARSATIGGLNIANNGTFYIRWSDTNDLGSDDGLAIDNFSLTPITAVAGVPEPASWALMIGGFGLIGMGARRRTRRSVVTA